MEEKGISMDTHLIEVKNVIDMLEKVDLMLPKDIIMYYTIQNLPKEYKNLQEDTFGWRSIVRL
jgi:hypothetical protein